MRHITLLALCALIPALHAATQTLQNDHTRIVFDDARHYSVVSLVERASDTEQLAADKLPDTASPWQLRFRKPDGRIIFVDALSPCDNVAVSRTDASLTIAWQGLHAPELKGKADFAMTVTLRPDGATLWTCRTTGEMDAQFWQLQFPQLHALRPKGDDTLAVPQYLGRLWHNPTTQRVNYTLTYPQSASMQFFAYWGTPDRRFELTPEQESGWQPDQTDASGVLFMADDPNGYFKHLSANTLAIPGTLSFACQNHPSLDVWPPKPDQTFPFDYRLPYTVVVRPFRGDLFTASRLYADWARQQPWCSAGPLPSANTADPLVHRKPQWFCDASFWTKFYHEPYKVLADWDAFQSWLRVPSPSHYYRYNMAVFDDNYPEHLPGKAYLLNGMRAARRMHVAPQPYLNGVIWDTDTQSYINEHGVNAVREEADGSHRIWNINNEYFHYMCPATEQWQRKMRETVRKQVWEHDMAGVYLDCLAATAASLCHNPAHGHPVHGGDYFTRGNRTLLYDLRRDIRATAPDAAFFTEEICEQYLDCLDGFLTLDFRRPTYLRPGEQLFPVFNLVYNPYVIDFGSDATLQIAPDLFALQMGLLYVWGCVPLISHGQPDYPQPGTPNSELLRHLVQGYHTYGRALTATAEMVRLSQRPLGSSLPASAVDVQSAPHHVDYTDVSRRKHQWHGPAVAAGAFRQGDTLTLLLCNLTDRPQDATLTVAPAAFSGAAPRSAQLLWPERRTLAHDTPCTLTLPPATTAIVLYSTSPAPAIPAPNPLLEQDWLLLRPTASGPFPTAPLPADHTLFACDDATVLCTLSPAPQAQMLVHDEHGNLTPRQAVVPPKIGADYSRHSQPRQRAGQPFALLHKIPFQADHVQSVRVLDGDDAPPLLAAVVTPVPGQTPVLTSSRHGILVCQRLNRTAAPVILPAADFPQALAQLGPADAADAPLLVGFADIPLALTAEVRRLSADRLSAEPLMDAIDAFRATPTPDTLAALSQAFHLWCTANAHYPELLAPDTPGHRLLRLVAALQFPFLNTITPPELIPEHDWLAPRIAKTIPYTGPQSPDDTIPAGNWQTAALVSKADHAFTLTVTDPHYAERLVPLTAWFPTANRGLFPALTWLECNRPYELQTQPLALPILAGTTANASVVLRNWSPLPLAVTFQTTLPDGLTAALPDAPTQLPPLSETPVAIPVTASPRVRSGNATLTVRTNHLDSQDTAVFGFIPLILSERLRPLAPPLPAPDANTPAAPRLRRLTTYAVYARAGQTVSLNLTNKRITVYNPDLKWELLDEARKPLLHGTLKVDETRLITYTPQTDATLFLKCDSGSGSVVLTSPTHVPSEVAVPAARVNLFCDTYTRYFYVRPDAKSFTLAVQDGGPGETAAITLESPTGRRPLQRDGMWNGNNAIAVQPDEAGRIWKLTVVPAQDVSFGFSGDVVPCLAPSPEHVLKGSD